MADSPIRTALSEAYMGDTALASSVFGTGEDAKVFDQRLLDLLQGLGLGPSYLTDPTTGAVIREFVKAFGPTQAARVAAVQQLLLTLGSGLAPAAEYTARPSIFEFLDTAKEIMYGIPYADSPTPKTDNFLRVSRAAIDSFLVSARVSSVATYAPDGLYSSGPRWIRAFWRYTGKPVFESMVDSISALYDDWIIDIPSTGRSLLVPGAVSFESVGTPGLVREFPVMVELLPVIDTGLLATWRLTQPGTNDTSSISVSFCGPVLGGFPSP